MTCVVAVLEFSFSIYMKNSTTILYTADLKRFCLTSYCVGKKSTSRLKMNIKGQFWNAHRTLEPGRGKRENIYFPEE